VAVPDGLRMPPDVTVLEALREVPVRDSDVLSRESFGALPLELDPVRALVGVVNTGMLDVEGVRDTGRLDDDIECRGVVFVEGRALRASSFSTPTNTGILDLVGVDVNTGIFEADAVRDILDLLTAAANPPDRLGEIPELLDPLGLRVRAATVAAMGADPFRGRVEDDPGRWLDATLALWKLDVRRIPVEVLCPPTPSLLSSDCMDPCLESAFRLAGRLPPPVLAGAESLRRSCKRNPPPSPSLTELSGVPPEMDGRIGELRLVLSRTLVMGPAVGREGDRA